RFAEMRGMDLAAAQDSFRRQVPVKRFGRPEEMGAFAAFLCSTHAGFMTGQNLMLDGGQYPGLF
ncbi:MAG: SDR family oxidoreductase, partial [Betaproteobacteria bacterium]